jgi:hypothetical protein
VQRRVEEALAVRQQARGEEGADWDDEHRQQCQVPGPRPPRGELRVEPRERVAVPEAVPVQRRRRVGGELLLEVAEAVRPARAELVRLLERLQVAIEKRVRQVASPRPPPLPRGGAVAPPEQVADDSLLGGGDVDTRVAARPVLLRAAGLQTAQHRVDDDGAGERAQHPHRERLDPRLRPVVGGEADPELACADRELRRPDDDLAEVLVGRAAADRLRHPVAVTGEEGGIRRQLERGAAGDREAAVALADLQGVGTVDRGAGLEHRLRCLREREHTPVGVVDHDRVRTGEERVVDAAADLPLERLDDVGEPLVREQSDRARDEQARHGSTACSCFSAAAVPFRPSSSWALMSASAFSTGSRSFFTSRLPRACTISS